MSEPTVNLVEDFHYKLDLVDHINVVPKIPSDKVNLVRIQGLVEEVGELAHALSNKNIEDTLDALCDIQYFLDGTFVACGLQGIKQQAFERVHEFNMRKAGFKRTPGGRIVKPDDWVGPQFMDMLEGYYIDEN